MTRPQRLAFLKVLAAVAWADGEIQEDERNRLKVLFNGFDLDGDHRRELVRLLARPVSFEEAVAMTKDFAGSLAPGGARRQLVEEIETMLGAESDRAPGERELLSHVRAILKAHTPIDGLLERFRGLFSGTMFPTRQEEAHPDDREDRDEHFLHDVIDDRPERDSDLQRICAEYSRHATMDDRLRVLERLFEHAARDGIIERHEVEHVHRIAHLLWISNPEYLAVRDRWRDRIE